MQGTCLVCTRCMYKGMGYMKSPFYPSTMYLWLRCQLWSWRKGFLWRGITIFSACISPWTLGREGSGALPEESSAGKTTGCAALLSLSAKSAVQEHSHLLPSRARGGKLIALPDRFSLIQNLGSGLGWVKSSFPAMGLLLLFRLGEVGSIWFHPGPKEASFPQQSQPPGDSGCVCPDSLTVHPQLVRRNTLLGFLTRSVYHHLPPVPFSSFFLFLPEWYKT